MPPRKFAADDCGSVQQHITIFRRTEWMPDDLAAGRNGDYIRCDMWTVPAVCNEPVTGSHAVGSSQDLDDAVYGGQTSLLIEKGARKFL